MASFRQRMAIQKHHKGTKNFKPFQNAKKNYQPVTKAYIKKAINMYGKLAVYFTPFSEEEKLCREMIFKLTIDLEVLEHGTYEERKEVVGKYGRGSS